MSQAEFFSWVSFYRLFPFDDLHRFHRPAAMVAQSNCGEYSKWLEFLAPDPSLVGKSEADANTMRAFQMLGAKKG